eukprot:1161431_1
MMKRYQTAITNKTDDANDDYFDAPNALNDENAAEDHCDDQATDSDVEIENVIKLLKLKLKRKKRTKKNQRARFKNGMKRYKMERKPRPKCHLDFFNIAYHGLTKEQIPEDDKASLFAVRPNTILSRQSMQSIGYNVSARIDDQSVIFKNKESVTYENDWIKSRKEIQTEIESNSLKGNIYTMENKPHSLNLLNKKKKTQRQKKKKHKHYRLNACDEPSYLEENAHGGAQQAIERDFIDENACVSRIMNDAQYNASIDNGDDGDTEGSNEDDDIRGDEDVSPRM